MSGSVVLLHLAGAVALMLFATRLVKTGVERAYGVVLRKRLRTVMGNPVMAVVTGCALAAALPRSTAVTMPVTASSWAGRCFERARLAFGLGRSRTLDSS